MSRNKEKGRLAPFVPLIKETISCPAWKALSHGARSLYACLKTRYSSNLKNNGRIYLSTRDATEELGSHSHRDNVRRWFRELQYFGFIVMRDPGCLGVDGRGKAPHWRLTEIGYMTDPPTRDYLRWSASASTSRKAQNITSAKNRIPDHPKACQPRCQVAACYVTMENQASAQNTAVIAA
jgi:hypothetical protein